MTTTCPKCSYTRQPTDKTPDYSCPSCGIVYAKYDAQADLARRIDRAAKTGNWSGVPPEHVPQQVQVQLQAREEAPTQQAPEQQRQQEDARTAALTPLQLAIEIKAAKPTTWSNQTISPGHALFLIAFVLVFIGLMSQATSPSGQSEKATEVSAFVQCKNFVNDRLRAPASADFPLLDRSSWDMGNNTWVVKSHVDSQNGFGAMIRSKWYCKVQHVGGNTLDQRSWRLLDIEVL